MIAQGYAEGLLTRNGRPVPLVRSAVRATIPVGRLIDLSASMAEGIARSAADGDPAIATGSAASTIAASGRRSSSTPIGCSIASRDAPSSSTTAHSSAALDPADIAGRRAQAAWASGNADLAGSILDGVPPREARRRRPHRRHVRRHLVAARA